MATSPRTAAMSKPPGRCGALKTGIVLNAGIKTRAILAICTPYLRDPEAELCGVSRKSIVSPGAVMVDQANSSQLNALLLSYRRLEALVC
jgi:hypothetical protein